MSTVMNRYPIYIPTKGRAATPLTAKYLHNVGLPFFLVCEETEAEQYEALDLGTVLVLPFHDLGQGSIPARNWIWDHALSAGARRHWVIDDNIKGFMRMNCNRKIPVRASGIFAAMEDFTDRYTNIAFSGPTYDCLYDERYKLCPYVINTRIYSCILVNSSLDMRWRGRYNEDTDICLRAMKADWQTLLFVAFLANKASTQTIKGGNTDNVYNTGDKRRAFAESLREQHPEHVKVFWRFDRWHHQVDYLPFKGKPLHPVKGLVPMAENNEYGMRLKRVEP